MRVRLSEEQVELGQLADRIGADLDGAGGDEAWAALVDVGLTALRVGPGAPTGSIVDAMVVVERLAAHRCSAPFLGQAVLAPELLRLADAPEELQAVVAAGGVRFAPVLDGELEALGASLALDASGAGQGVVVLDDGRMGTVDLGGELVAADLTRALRPAVGRVAPLEGTRLVADDRARFEAVALALLAADVVGALDGGLGLAVEHAREREQFGRPIGSFQAIQHLLADAVVAIESVRSAAWFASWACDALPAGEARLAARVAKAQAASVGREVAEALIQAGGGMAMTWEHPAHVVLRRVLVSVAALGGEDGQLAAIADARLAPRDGAPGRLAGPGGDGDGRAGLDYRDSVEEAAFRAELRSWLGAHPHRVPDDATDTERAALLGEWHRDLYEAGFMGLSWPAAAGGRERPAVYEAILNDEVGRAGAPALPHVGYLGRALLLFGSEAQQRTLLRGLLSGEEVWCQGFSEPGAGSDLAALRTRATLRPGGGWVIDGQKVWTSDAPWADRCLLLARTDPEAPKHAGISAFVVPMHAPGVEVRPLTLFNGDREFSEVFFDGVEVGADAIVGEPGQGWELAMATVGYERGPADIGFSSRYTALRAALEAEVRAGPVVDDPVVRRRVGRAYVLTEVLRLHVLRSLAARADGEPPGPEGSIDKLLGTRTEQELHHLAMDLRGSAPLVGADPVAWREYLYSRAQSIAGGTSQIQRTIVAERVLGLPRHR